VHWGRRDRGDAADRRSGTARGSYYLGFVLSPALVGLAAEATSLRAALGGIALLAALLAFASRFAPVPERVFVRRG
jgi:hypothetical protein